MIWLEQAGVLLYIGGLFISPFPFFSVLFFFFWLQHTETAGTGSRRPPRQPATFQLQLGRFEDDGRAGNA